MFIRNNELYEIMLHAASDCQEEILKVNLVLTDGQKSYEIHLF